MIFRTAYYHPMDREYHDKTIEDIGVSVKDVGMSVPLGIAASDVQGIAATIRQGVGSIELQFPGAGKGQRYAHTPEMYGKDQREAIRELMRANEIGLTTHATWGIAGLSGQDQHGNFSDEHRKFAVDEVKRAIEFAADTAGKGSIVVHMSEFPRPISEEEWAREGSELKFRHYPEEPEKAIVRVVDERTGQVLTQVRKNQIVPRAVWNTYEGAEGYTDSTGQPVKPGDYIDYNGNRITELRNRVPKYDPTKNTFVIRRQTWDDFVKEAQERNEIEAKKKRLSVEEFRRQYANEYVLPEEAFLQATTETQEAISKGWAGNYSQRLDREFESLKKLKKAREYYKKVEEAVSEEEKWKLIQYIRDTYRDVAGLVPPDAKMPTELLDKAIKETERDVDSIKDMVTGQLQSAEEQAILREHAMSAKKYALEKSMQSIAETGLYSMERSKYPDKPLFVALENVTPESYGGHPSELKSLVLGAREKMSDILHKKGYSEGKAKEIAEKHIKATLDTGHLNTWRKYYTGTDEEFKKWLLEQTEDLAKAGVIGNVHLSDNFGYQDDHLAPGQGITPVKEMVAILKKHGYKEALTVEPGADATTDLSAFHGLMKTWRYFGSPVYGTVEPTRFPGKWVDIQHSYFGRTYPPYFIFGAYAPSNEWTLWSGIPME